MQLWTLESSTTFWESLQIGDSRLKDKSIISPTFYPRGLDVVDDQLQKNPITYYNTLCTNTDNDLRVTCNHPVTVGLTWALAPVFCNTPTTSSPRFSNPYDVHSSTGSSTTSTTSRKNRSSRDWAGLRSAVTGEAGLVLACGIWPPRRTPAPVPRIHTLGEPEVSL